MKSLSDALLDTVNDWSQVIGLIALVVTLVAAWGAYATSREMTRRTSEKEKSLLDENREKSERLEVAEKKVAELSTQGDDLERKAKDRTITPGQRTNLMALLKPFKMARPMQRDIVKVLASPMDGEALSYAEQIADVLRECRFEVIFDPGVQTGGPKSGIALFIGNPERPPQHATVILRAFESSAMQPLGLWPWHWPDKLGADSLLIFVSQKSWD